MNPVAATNTTADTGSARAPVQPLPGLVAGVAQEVSFGRLLAKAKVSGPFGAHGPKLPTLPTVTRPSTPPASRGVVCRPGADAGAGSVSLLHVSGRSESFDPLPRRYLAGDVAAWLSCTGLPVATGCSEAPEAAARSAVSLEDLLPTLVRRVAWSGDGRRGTARLEIGSGDLAGAMLLVHVDAGRVRVLLEAPPGADVRSWRERIVKRLVARNVPFDDVEVS